ncbi:uncharacterized protein LOC129944945 [Eupeodes corollae]|uniref:uncharacterized protein LOC129944945 n=1 Tax=Eupeodes corollae TaxID=290404 RepID=UPI002490AD00|nr:uncharacterized protein LOC129944945 [Eupeodes corollae]
MDNNEDKTNNSNNATAPAPALEDAPETITRVAIRIPSFWHEKPQIWFAQIEAQFKTANISKDSSKFNTIIGAIESQVLTQVSDAVLNPPSENKYENLKSLIIERFGDSEQRKIKKLLSDVDLGDKRPSQLLLTNSKS